MFDILKQERHRPVMPQDRLDIEKEVALFLVGEAMATSQRVLLGNARERKGLTGKSCEQHFVFGDPCRVRTVGSDVAHHDVIVIIDKILPVGSV